MILTAEKLLEKYQKEFNENGIVFDLKEPMIEFAKLHVEAALKAAELEAFRFVDIDEEECYKPQIINCYPKKLIK